MTQDTAPVTQEQIEAALRKRPRFKLAEFVPPNAYRAVGLIISLERDGIDRAYAIGVASNMFRIAKPQLRELVEQADDGGAVGRVVDLIHNFHDQNRVWAGIPRSDWKYHGEDVVDEIKRRLNNMLDALGEPRIE